MITILTKENKIISQSSYDTLVNRLPLPILPCTCGHTGSLTRHAYYKRSVKIASEKITLKILRLKCSACGCTHAVFPSLIIPYSQIIFDDQQQIVRNYEFTQSNQAVMEHNILIDENNICSIIRQYNKHWKQRLFAEKVLLTEDLTKRCFQHFSRHFMQIRRTPNLLFLKPT